MISYIGLDWSGTPGIPTEKGECYLACAVGIEDIDLLNQFFSDWRQYLGVSRDFEFHGSRANPEIIQTAIEHALEEAAVSIVWFDKNKIVGEMDVPVFEKPALLAPATGLLALTPLLEQFSVRRIWCDEDIQSKDRQREFTTSLKHIARKRSIALNIKEVTPDVKHYPSNKSNMIQFADLIAYALQRDLRGLPDSAKRHFALERLRNKEGNIIRMGLEDDLRPYL